MLGMILQNKKTILETFVPEIGLIYNFNFEKWYNVFPCRYTREDIMLLAKVDEWHQTLSGPATKKICERAFYVYKENAFENLAHISTGHLYNLRKTYLYEQQRRYFTKTQKSQVNIGIRRKPSPNGQPGFIRVDTVHQGDEDKRKGIYHINAVDEVTQFEVVVTVCLSGKPVTAIKFYG